MLCRWTQIRGTPQRRHRGYRGGGIGELRNCLAHQMLRVVFRPTYRLLRKLGRRHGLPREPMIFSLPV